MLHHRAASIILGSGLKSAELTRMHACMLVNCEVSNNCQGMCSAMQSRTQLLLCKRVYDGRCERELPRGMYSKSPGCSTTSRIGGASSAAAKSGLENRGSTPLSSIGGCSRQRFLPGNACALRRCHPQAHLCVCGVDDGIGARLWATSTDTSHLPLAARMRLCRQSAAQSPAHMHVRSSSEH